MDAKAGARERLEAARDELVALSHRIHAHPELGFEEERASGWLAEMLDAAGFKVSRGICELPTAFVAEAGSGPLCVALCAEYDCLPGIGHACGHNVIAAMAAGAGIGLLRQHIRQTDRIHGIVTRGGDMPNVVPAHTEAHYIVRARTLADLGEVRAKVLRCFEAGALATGARLAVADDHEPYTEMEHDREIAALYRRNAEALGRTFPDLGLFLERAAGSTDMGNISLAIPSIHPYIGIDSLPAVNHQPEFAAHCATAAADRALADGALAMAWTAVDLATDGAVREKLVTRLAAR